MDLMIKNLSRFKLITFDVTDTLLRFTLPPAIQYAKTASKFGYPNIDQHKVIAEFSTQFKQMSEKYPNFGRGSEIDWQKWWHLLVKNIFQKAGQITNDSDLDRIANRLVEQYKTAECWTPLPGSIELLNKIKTCDKIVGVISNMDPRIGIVLKNLNLPKFDFVINSYDAGVWKPNTKIFDIALSQCTNYNTQCNSYEALHIGNTPHLDYIGARQAGWSSVIVKGGQTNLDKYRNVPKNHLFTSLHDLKCALELTTIKF